MIFPLVALACIVVGAQANCASENPLDITKKLYYKSCNPSAAIQPYSVKVLDDSGNINYPINVGKPIVIQAESHNTGDTVDKTLIDVTLAQYTKAFFQSKCQWNNLPTFGLLNNIDGCKAAGNCPLKGHQGTITLNVKIDLSQYSEIIKVLGAGTPYQIGIHIHENDDGKKTEVSCLTVGVMISKS